MKGELSAASSNASDSNDVSALFDDDTNADGLLLSCVFSFTLLRFPSFLERKHYVKKNARAGVWNFFEVCSNKALWHIAYCTICQVNVNYTLTMSTGMLTRHMRSKHWREYEAMLEEEAFKKIDANYNSSCVSTQDLTDKLQCSIENFVEFSPMFEKNRLLGLLILTNLCMFLSILL
jgi:hypothetical protein